MGQTLCNYRYPYNWNDASASSTGKKTTTTTTLAPYWHCEFQVWDVLDHVNTNSGVLLVLIFASLIMVALTWVLTFFIRFKDYSRSYIASNLVPMTLLCVVRAIQVIFNGVNNDRLEVYAPSSFFTGTTVLQFLFSTVVFMTMNLYSAVKRVEIKRGCVLYGICLLLSVIYNLFETFVPYYWRISSTIKLIYSPFILISGALFLGIGIISIFSYFCCSSPKSVQSSVPAVGNVRSRMLWSLVYVFYCCIVLLIGMKALRDVFRLFVDYNYMDVVFGLEPVVVFLHPGLFCLFTIMFLPAYRSAFFCSQGYGNGKVADLEAKPQRTETKPSPPVTPPAQLTQTLSIPAVSQANSPYLNTPRPGPAQHDFGSVLTNPPNAVFYQNQPLPTPIPISLPGQHSQQFVFPGQQISTSPYDPLYTQPLPSSVPSVQTYGTTVPMQQFYMAPSTTVPVEQYQVVQHQPQVLTQHQLVAPAPMRHHVVSTPQLVTAPIQTNLVRFASQPNLAPMTTLHTTVSTPHLNLVPQSPFYISN